MHMSDLAGDEKRSTGVGCKLESSILKMCSFTKEHVLPQKLSVPLAYFGRHVRRFASMCCMCL